MLVMPSDGVNTHENATVTIWLTEPHWLSPWLNKRPWNAHGTEVYLRAGWNPIESLSVTSCPIPELIRPVHPVISATSCQNIHLPCPVRPVVQYEALAVRCCKC